MASTGTEQDEGSDQLHSGRRVLAVLEAIAARPRGVTPKELSKALKLHLSTCYRLLNTLLAAGYVVRSPDSLFHLGQRVAYLNHRYLASIRPRPEVLAFLHALQMATGETAMLMRLEGDDAVATAFAAGTRVGAHPAEYAGIAGPAYALAAGRVLLAWLPEARQEAYLARFDSSPPLPWFPQVPSEDLRGDLARIRQLGYAIDRGEGNPNVCCIAAPIHDRAGVNTSIATIAPCARLMRDEAQVRPVLIEVARAISGVLTTLPQSGEEGHPVDLAPEAVTQAAIEAALATVSDAMSRVT